MCRLENTVSGRGNSMCRGPEVGRDQLGWSVVLEDGREVGRAEWAVDEFGFYSKGRREPVKPSEKGLK